MIRHARRASLLVAFTLLTSAATAYAECAWVLWATSPGVNTLFMSLPLGGWKTLEECERVRATKQGERTVFACLPDTVDPRGPKR